MHVYAFIIILIRANTGHGFSKIPLTFILFCNDIYCLDPVTVIETAEFALITQVIKYLNLIYDVRRQVPGCQFWIIIKKSLTIDQHPAHGFALSSNSTVLVHLDARHLF